MAGEHGGRRKGAGRKPGSITTRTREIAEQATAAGETPLEYMLRVMRDKTVDHLRRDAMSKAAAPFCHPHLASAQPKPQGDVIVPLHERLDALTREDAIEASEGKVVGIEQARTLSALSAVSAGKAGK